MSDMLCKRCLEKNPSQRSPEKKQKQGSMTCCSLGIQPNSPATRVVEKCRCHHSHEKGLPRLSGREKPLREGVIRRSFGRTSRMVHLN